MNLDFIVNKAMDLCEDLLRMEFEYEYADVNVSNPAAVKMIVASFIKEKNLILINPKALDVIPGDMNIKSGMFFSNICHECYHAYQWKTNPKIFDTRKSIKENGLNYASSELEIEAYGFQECILKYIFQNEAIKMDLRKLDESVQKAIHDKANSFYIYYIKGKLD